MKNLVLLLAALVPACFTVNAQTTPDWTRVLQSTTYNFPFGRVVTADADNIYLAGNISGPVTFNSTTYTGVGMSDMIVFKLTTTGNVTWSKQFISEATGSIFPTTMQVDANQNLFITGTFSGLATFGSSTIISDATANYFITKIDINGNALWATAFAATGTGSNKMVFDSDGNTYLLNKTASLIKFDNTGNKIWEQKYPDRTLQAIAAIGPDLYIGGALQQGTTTFGTFNLVSAGTYNTGFMAKADLNGIYNKTLVEGIPPLSTKEGNYHAVGTFDHPTSGLRTFDLTKSLIATEENVLSTTVGDLGSGTLILTINTDNSISISGTAGSAPIVPSGDNSYDPITKSFTLNYSYTTTGTRVISEVLTKIPATIGGDGTSICDFTIDADGNLLLAGSYTKDLTLDKITITNTTSSHYAYIAKCDSNFSFEWIKSSDAISNTREMYAYRLFQDNLNNIYQYGLSNQGATTYTYGSVSVVQQPQFLFKFDANGEVLAGYGFQTTYFSRIFVEPEGKIVITGPVGNDGISQYGNIFIAQYFNDMSIDWQKNTSDHQAGTFEINYVKHDNSGNTYAQARIRGYCNFFGTLIKSNFGTTINAKFDKSGNVLWINQIDDLASSMIYGPKFSLDKDNNLLTVGTFSTSLTIGNHNFTNTNTLNDGYIVKYDPDGQVLWATQLATDGSHTIYGITSDQAGNVIVSGEFKNQLSVDNKTIDAASDDGAFIIKLGADGNCTWANGFPIGDVVYSAMPATDENNNIYMAGEMYNYTTNQLVFGSVIAPQSSTHGGTVLVKFDPDGIPQWAYTYGGGAVYSPDGWPTDIKTDAAGNSYLLGYCSNHATFGSTILTNPIGISYSYYLTKINTSGGVDWAEAVYFKSPVYRYGDLLDLDKNGNVYIGGHFRNTIQIQGTNYNPAGTNDFFVSRYSNNGVFEWIKTMPDNTSGISALSVYNEDVLSFCGIAGKDPMLGNFPIERKGTSTNIIATLGTLESLPNTLFVDFTEGSATTFSFTSNTDWTVSSDQIWLTINTESGTGNGTLIFTATENTTGEARTAIVTITFLNTKSPSITITIVQEAGTTGIADLQKNKNLVYPNPTSNYLFLNPDDPDALISIYNSKGKMVLNKQVNDNKINISSLRNGIYTIRIATKTGTKTQKFVKQ